MQGLRMFVSEGNGVASTQKVNPMSIFLNIDQNKI